MGPSVHRFVGSLSKILCLICHLPVERGAEKLSDQPEFPPKQPLCTRPNHSSWRGGWCASAGEQGRGEERMVPVVCRPRPLGKPWFCWEEGGLGWGLLARTRCLPGGLSFCCSLRRPETKDMDKNHGMCTWMDLAGFLLLTNMWFKHLTASLPAGPAQRRHETNDMHITTQLATNLCQHFSCT